MGLSLKAISCKLHLNKDNGIFHSPAQNPTHVNLAKKSKKIWKKMANQPKKHFEWQRFMIEHILAAIRTKWPTQSLFLRLRKS